MNHIEKLINNKTVKSITFYRILEEVQKQKDPVTNPAYNSQSLKFSVLFSFSARGLAVDVSSVRYPAPAPSLAQSPSRLRARHIGCSSDHM